MPCTAAWTLASSPPTSPANRCASLCWMPCSVSAGAPRPAYSFCQQSAAGWQAAACRLPGQAATGRQRSSRGNSAGHDAAKVATAAGGGPACKEDKRVHCIDGAGNLFCLVVAVVLLNCTNASQRNRERLDSSTAQRGWLSSRRLRRDAPPPLKHGCQRATSLLAHNRRHHRRHRRPPPLPAWPPCAAAACGQTARKGPEKHGAGRQAGGQRVSGRYPIGGCAQTGVAAGRLRNPNARRSSLHVSFIHLVLITVQLIWLTLLLRLSFRVCRERRAVKRNMNATRARWRGAGRQPGAAGWQAHASAGMCRGARARQTRACQQQSNAPAARTRLVAAAA